jgi:hypothetical protein
MKLIRGNLHLILLGALIVAVFFGGTLWALDTIWPRDTLREQRPELVALEPLQPVAREADGTAAPWCATSRCSDRF